MTDLTRYLPGTDGTGRLALWCTDCEVVGGLDDAANHIDNAPIWTEDDAAEQVTELSLANLVATAEQHEREHHRDRAEKTTSTSSCTAEVSDHTCTCLTAED